MALPCALPLGPRALAALRCRSGSANDLDGFYVPPLRPGDCVQHNASAGRWVCSSLHGSHVRQWWRAGGCRFIGRCLCLSGIGCTVAGFVREMKVEWRLRVFVDGAVFS